MSLSEAIEYVGISSRLLKGVFCPGEPVALDAARAARIFGADGRRRQTGRPARPLVPRCRTPLLSLGNGRSGVDRPVTYRSGTTTLKRASQKKEAAYAQPLAGYLCSALAEPMTIVAYDKATRPEPAAAGSHTPPNLDRPLGYGPIAELKSASPAHTKMHRAGTLDAINPTWGLSASEPQRRNRQRVRRGRSRR